MNDHIVEIDNCYQDFIIKKVFPDASTLNQQHLG